MPPLPSARQHPSYGDYLEVNIIKTALCWVVWKCSVSSTLIWAVLTGPADWVCHNGTLTGRLLGIAIPGFPNPGIPEIFQFRDWAALNPGISGLTKFIYLTVFLVLFKVILCIYSFFDAFLSPQWGGEGAVVLGPTCDRVSGAQKLADLRVSYICLCLGLAIYCRLC